MRVIEGDRVYMEALIIRALCHIDWATLRNNYHE